MVMRNLLAWWFPIVLLNVFAWNTHFIQSFLGKLCHSLTQCSYVHNPHLYITISDTFLSNDPTGVSQMIKLDTKTKKQEIQVNSHRLKWEEKNISLFCLLQFD